MISEKDSMKETNDYDFALVMHLNLKKDRLLKPPSDDQICQQQQV